MKEIEKTLLITAILRPQSRYKIFELSTEHFYIPAHQIIFDALRFLDDQSQNIEINTVRAYLQSVGDYDRCGGDDYFYKELVTADSTFSEGFLVNQLLDRADKEYMKGIVKDVLTGKMTKEEGLLKLDSIGKVESDTFIDIEGFSKLDLDDIFKKENFISTGIPSFDRRNGGVCRTDLIIIAARPKLGKSALALQIANYINHSIFISLEMGRYEIYGRLLAHESGVNSRLIKQKYMTHEQFLKVNKVHLELKDRLKLIFADKIVNLNDIIIFIKKTVSIKKVNAIFIDYIQLIEAGGNMNRDQQIGLISRKLKQTAQTLGIPIFVLSQLKRDSENKHRPTLSDLRESGNLEQDANIVLLLYQDEETGVTEIINAKSRDGESNYTINTMFYKETSKFIEIEV